MENFISDDNRPYAMYLRKSRKDLEAEEHGEGETLARHLNILEILAKNMKIAVFDEYIYKEIISGETIEARPRMQELLDKVEQGFFKGVLVVEIERLARGDSIDQGIVARAFKVGNAKIVTPVKIYDPNNEFDEEYFEFGLFMSRREYKTITRRLQTGRIMSAKEGKFVGSTPTYGYSKTKLKGQKGYMLIVNDQESKIVKLIFDLYINKKMGSSKIAKQLDDLSIMPRRGIHWSYSTIQDILSNTHYIGKIKFNNRVTVKNIKNGKIEKSRHKYANQEVIYVDGLHESIIDNDTFEKAQELKKNKYITRKSVNLNLKNPLAGILKCKKCGLTITKGNVRGKSYLYCKNQYCDNIGNYLDNIEDKILSFLEIWLKDTNLIIPNIKNDNSLTLKQDILKNKENLLNISKLKIDNIYDLFEEKVYDKNIFLERSNKMNETISTLIEEIKKLKDEINSLNSLQVDSITFIPKLEYVLRNYKKTDDIETKNKLLKDIIDKIYYLKDTKGNRWHDESFEIWILPKIKSNFIL